MKNTKRQSNNIIILVSACLVVLLILVSLFIIWKTTDGNSQTSKSGDSTKSTDKYFGWKIYCSKVGGICLKYPKDWGLGDTPDGASIAITNPSSVVQVIYTPSVKGVGGYCPPNNCFFRVLSVGSLYDSSIALSVVKGIYNNVADGSIAAQYFVSNNDKISAYKLKSNETIDTGSIQPFFLSSPHDPNILEQLYIKPLPDIGFNSEQAATTWLSGTDIKTAGNILESLSLN